MNFLVDIIPPAARKYVYAVIGIAGFVLGALQLSPVEIPEWVFAVYAFVAASAGTVATANTNVKVEAE